MSRYYYDLHLHSCLSPCADDDMTPANIAGMGSLCGLQLMALTDHNTCGNCRAFMAACRSSGIVGIPGMELTTSEEIHLVCLFPELEDALSFEEHIRPLRMPVKNRPDVFGNQLQMDENDNVTGEEPFLLIPAAGISLEGAFALAVKLGGIAFPAHIDREANGILAILGSLPEKPAFSVVELNGFDNIQSYTERYHLDNKNILVSSDAHHLWDIRDAGPFLELDDEPYSSARVRHELIHFLRGESGT